MHSGLYDGSDGDSTQSMCWLSSLFGAVNAILSFLAAVVMALTLISIDQLRTHDRSVASFFLETSGKWHQLSMAIITMLLPVLLLIQLAAWSYLLTEDKDIGRATFTVFIAGAVIVAIGIFRMRKKAATSRAWGSKTHKFGVPWGET